MTYAVDYHGHMGENPIHGATEIESISITGCLQNFCNKMRKKGVDIKKITIQQLEEETQNESPAR